LDAGRHAARRIALAREHRAAVQQRGRCARRGRSRVGQLQCGEVAGDVHQIGIAERIDHAGHEAVMAAPVAKVQQLVVEVARRLAGQARVVAIGPGAALLAMAGGAGQQALGHAVFESGGGQRHAHNGGEGQQAGCTECSHGGDHAKTARPDHLNTFFQSENWSNRVYSSAQRPRVAIISGVFLTRFPPSGSLPGAAPVPQRRQSSLPAPPGLPRARLFF